MFGLLDHAPLDARAPQLARLRANAAYFDGLLSLIPADAYFGPAAGEREAAWAGRFARNKAGRAPEQARKEASKAAARTARFNPGLAAGALVPALVAARAAADAAHLAGALRAADAAGGGDDGDGGAALGAARARLLAAAGGGGGGGGRHGQLDTPRSVAALGAPGSGRALSPLAEKNRSRVVERERRAADAGGDPRPHLRQD